MQRKNTKNKVLSPNLIVSNTQYTKLQFMSWKAEYFYEWEVFISYWNFEIKIYFVFLARKIFRHGNIQRHMICTFANQNERIHYYFHFNCVSILATDGSTPTHITFRVLYHIQQMYHEIFHFWSIININFIISVT